LGPAGCGRQKTRITSTLPEIEALTGLSFPHESVILAEHELTSDDEVVGIWTLRAEDMIVFSELSNATEPVEVVQGFREAVAFVESTIRGHRIIQPERAWRTQWSRHRMEFRATLIKSANGYFVAIEVLR
jgi:hypothetical protein